MTGKLSILKDVANNSYLGIIIDDSPELNKEVLDEVAMFKTFREDAAILIEKQQSRDKGHRHITVFTVMECQKDPKTLSLEGAIINDLKLFGIGSINIDKDGVLMETFYVLAQSELIQELRHRYDLKDKDLHVTIGFTHKDLFHKFKDIGTLL